MADEQPARAVRDTLDWAIRLSRRARPRQVVVPSVTEALEVPPLPAAGAVVSRGGTPLAILAALATLYTLWIARPVALPIVIAILLSFLLRPGVRFLRRRGIREPLGAGFVVLGGVFLVVVSLSLLSGPATSWVRRAPDALTVVERKLRAIAAPVIRWEATAERMEQLASGGAPSRAAPVATQPPTPRVGLFRRVFGGFANVFVMAVSVVFLTYFLLASGDLFMRKVMKVLPWDAEQTMPQQISDEVEVAVSRYLRTSMLINVGVGVATWLTLKALGMPNAGLWGTLAGLLNVIPYLGAVLTALVLAVAAVTVYDEIGRALLVPGAFLLLNLVESNVVTPLLMGRQFPVNTVALFVGVMAWGFIWGVPGAILAVPIMVTLKIVCDHVPALRTVGEFIGQ